MENGIVQNIDHRTKRYVLAAVLDEDHGEYLLPLTRLLSPRSIRGLFAGSTFYLVARLPIGGRQVHMYLPGPGYYFALEIMDFEFPVRQ